MRKIAVPLKVGNQRATLLGCHDSAEDSPAFGTIQNGQHADENRMARTDVNGDGGIRL